MTDIYIYHVADNFILFLIDKGTLQNSITWTSGPFLIHALVWRQMFLDCKFKAFTFSLLPLSIITLHALFGIVQIVRNILCRWESSSFFGASNIRWTMQETSSSTSHSKIWGTLWISYSFACSSVPPPSLTKVTACWFRPLFERWLGWWQ